MDKRYEKLIACRDYVRTRTDFVPKAALVLGSGLGGFASQLEVECEIPYADIPASPCPPCRDTRANYLRPPGRRARRLHAGPRPLL